LMVGTLRFAHPTGWSFVARAWIPLGQKLRGEWIPGSCFARPGM